LPIGIKTFCLAELLQMGRRRRRRADMARDVDLLAPIVVERQHAFENPRLQIDRHAASAFRSLLTEASEASASSPAPTPGAFYRIRPGDTLLGVAGRAYGLSPGGERLAAARRINDAAYNRRFRDSRLTDNGLFPGGRISFNPRFDCDLTAQAWDPRRAPSGRCFATIWLPGDAPTGRRVIENAPGDPVDTVQKILRGMTKPAGDREARCDEPSQHLPVVGSDERKPVRDTSRAPFRWICKIVSVFPPEANGDRPTGDGTGFLINPGTIVTAGHNLDNPTLGAHNPDLGIADYVLVLPGLNKTAPFDTSALSAEAVPFGAFPIERRSGTASNFFVAPEWRSGKSPLHDYGLIRFRKDQPQLPGAGIDDGWNTVVKGLADVSVANVERQKRARAHPEEILRLLRLHSGQIATTGYSGDRPCRQLGARGGQTRRFWCPDDPRCSGDSSHNLMESFLDTTGGNSGAPYWIIKDRGKGRRQHILIGIHTGGLFPFDEDWPEPLRSNTIRVASFMLVITPEVWRRLTDRSLLHAL
jgi:V8-like Glu-specific endopeptidase